MTIHKENKMVSTNDKSREQLVVGRTVGRYETDNY